MSRMLGIIVAGFCVTGLPERAVADGVIGAAVGFVAGFVIGEP